jgi:hypothetical protein
MINEVDDLLDRHREVFRQVLRSIIAEESGEDPFTLSLQRFRELNDEERAEFVLRAALIARGWIGREFRSLNAAWVIVVGGEVVASSPDPRSVPSPEEVLQCGTEQDRVAYLFEASLIEELLPSIASWSEVGGPDFYPTLPLALVASDTAEQTYVTADLDTGSHATLLDAVLVGTPSPTWFVGHHLGEAFLWAPVMVDVSIATSAGEMLRRMVPLRQVRDWSVSPFVKIQPRRRALVGRDFLRAFSLSLVLRTPHAETEVVTAS